MVGLKLELAQFTGTFRTSSDPRDIKPLDETSINELCYLLDEIAAGDTGHELCSLLNPIELGDNNLQFLRLSKDYDKWPSPEIVSYIRKLASISQSFYRCISMEQWLRTVVERQDQSPVVEICSNVVPRQAYLERFEAESLAACPGNGCSGGFSQASAVDQHGALLFQTCTNCALVQQLRGRPQVDSEIVRFWFLEEEDVKFHSYLGKPGAQGKAQKVLWRNGVFAQKVFFFQRDFEVEVRVSFEVSHPNIVHCFGFANWESEEPLSLFMELLEEDLESHLQTRDGEPMSSRDVLHILLQFAEAMEHLHQKNFVHGDLKPRNILLSHLTMPHSNVKSYLVKVADFGNTQCVDPDSGAVEKFNAYIGTSYYTAPEVFMRRDEKDRRPREFLCPKKLDVYSYAVVAYQVLTGTPCNAIGEGFSKGRVVLPDTNPDQWRPNKYLDDRTYRALGPDGKKLLDSISNWWASAPESRPTFTKICTVIRALQRN